jgi:hypothetical protein
LVGQTLRAVGLGLMLVGGLGLVAPSLPAHAQILAPLAAIGRAVQQIAQADQEPQAEESPTPIPSPTPTPTLETVRGGPVTFSLIGGISAGTRMQSSTTGGSGFFPGPSPSPSATPFGLQGAVTENQTQTLSNASMLAEVSRRTALSSVDLKLPLGLGNNGTQLGTVQALYSTPKYSLGYGAQPLTIFGQLPAGGTLRGPSLILPLADGDQTFYEGASTGADGEVLRLFGYRLRGEKGNNYWEAGFADGNGPLTGNAATLTGGAATSFGPISLIGEAAWQTRVNPGPGQASPGGLATAFRADDQLANSNLVLSIRNMPENFVSYGIGSLEQDNYIGTNYQITGNHSQDLLFNASWERYGDVANGIQQQRLALLSYNGPWFLGNYGIGLQAQQLNSTTSSAQSSVGATLQNSTSNRFATLFTTLQLMRTTAGDIGVTASTGLGFEVERQFGAFNGGFGGQFQRQTSSNAAPSLQAVESLNLSRSFGRTSFGIGDSFTHSISGGSPGSNATSQTPNITVGRQISPALSVAVNYGIQELKDKLNPAVDGHSRIFGVQITSPFSFGNGVVTGRTDPRLPATIIGRVQTDITTLNPALAGFATSGSTNGGVGNIIVTLDDRYVQRTDLTGGFQFSFISPGQHQLRIETSSVPRGFTVDSPVQTLALQGGQTAQVLFQIGNYGGILGHVYGLDAAGNEVPLSNVMVRVDEGAYSQTDTTGAYGFGHLGAGNHEVAIVPSTVPAFVTFDTASEKRTASVQNGQYTTVDFRAEPLGSITGKILYGSDMGNQAGGGVMNAYVVAEPGEHAAIDEDDGSFVIDNLPPGQYTVSVDPETLETGLGAQPESVAVELSPREHYRGVVFTVGRFEKKVVFSFLGSGAKAPTAAGQSVQLSEARLPPYGSSNVTVPVPQAAKSVSVSVFGRTKPLTYDARAKGWVGEIEVAAGQAAGEYSVTATVGEGTVPAPATLTVDPKMPIAIVQLTPPTAAQGDYVRVRARFLVDARPGDKIEWEDGQTTVLGKPVSGRVFTFTKVLSLRPLHGVLLTAAGRLPIELL